MSPRSAANMGTLDPASAQVLDHPTRALHRIEHSRTGAGPVPSVLEVAQTSYAHDLTDGQRRESTEVRHAYVAGWRWGLVCGLFAGTLLVCAALALGLQMGGAA